MIRLHCLNCDYIANELRFDEDYKLDAGIDSDGVPYRRHIPVLVCPQCGHDETEVVDGTE